MNTRCEYMGRDIATLTRDELLVALRECVHEITEKERLWAEDAEIRRALHEPPLVLYNNSQL